MASLLAVVGGHLWSPEQVAAHKAAELAKAPPPSRLWPLVGFFEVVFGLVLNCCLLIMTIAAAGAAACLFMGLASYFGSFFGYPPLRFSNGTLSPVSGLLVCSILCVLACMFGNFVDAVGTFLVFRPPAAWKRVREFDYEGILPPQAKHLIAHAKDFNPQARIRIHVLMQKDRVLDPILEIDDVVCLVWDADGTIVLPHD